jgi:hypothetical protein
MLTQRIKSIRIRRSKGSCWAENETFHIPRGCCRDGGWAGRLERPERPVIGSHFLCETVLVIHSYCPNYPVDRLTPPDELANLALCVGLRGTLHRWTQSQFFGESGGRRVAGGWKLLIFISRTEDVLGWLPAFSSCTQKPSCWSF